MSAPAALLDLLQQLTDEHGEEAVRRALSLTPALALVRDEASFHLQTAHLAADTPGISGKLVIGVPRKPNEPSEVNWVGGKATLTLST